MKVLAASNIVQYEKAVSSLSDYYRTVELGLAVCFLEAGELTVTEKHWQSESEDIGAIIFGSDQGLVGQFNDSLSAFAVNMLKQLPGEKKIWAVGERMQSKLEDAGLAPSGIFPVPNSVNKITPLIGQLLIESDAFYENGLISQLYIFHNKPKTRTIYESVVQNLLPLDEKWRNNIAQLRWPTKKIPEALNGSEFTLQGLIRQYLFISLFRSCAESLASENASRLAAMQRAEKNIDEMLEELNRSFRRQRQRIIDEELFDVISGSEALSNEK